MWVQALGSTSAEVQVVETQWALGSVVGWVLGLALVAVFVLGLAQEQE